MKPKPSSEPAPTHLKDLKPDARNARLHTPRNVGMIVDSLHDVGAARSIVIDETGTILAGNATADAAAEAGITKLKVVDADGETIVAVRRTGLTEKQKRRLALYDNRTAELAGWSPTELGALNLEDPELMAKTFKTEELAKIIVEAPVDFPSVGSDLATDFKCPKCGYAWSGKQA